MRLFYRWFCRVIGVGSVLDMVNLYLTMVIWIAMFLCMCQPENVDSKKHRSPHRHGHHRHHNHRKHPKTRHNLSLDGNFSAKLKKRSAFSPKDLNIENIVIPTSWVFNQTSSTLIFNSSYVDNEEGVTYRNINISKSPELSNFSQTFNDLNNLTNFENYTKDSKGSNLNNSFDSGNYTTPPNKDFNYIPKDSKIVVGVIEELTTQISAQSNLNSSRVVEPEETKTEDSIGSVASTASFNITEIEQEQVAEDLQKLFGSVENQKSLTDAIGTPVVQLIRKKRSAVTEEKEDDAVGATMREPTLLDFSGPPILNDPEEIGDPDSSNAVHKRVKRDGSELDDDRSALSSLDSTYLRNLEDSFALSALEVQAQGSRTFTRTKRQTIGGRKNINSLGSIARIKRDTESNVQEDSDSAESMKPSSGNPVSEDNNYNSNNQPSLDSDRDINSNEVADYSIEKSSDFVSPKRLKEVEDLTERILIVHVNGGDDVNYNAVGSETSTSANFLATNVNFISRKEMNGLGNREDSPISVDSNNGRKTNSFKTESLTSTPANFLAMGIDSIPRNSIVKDLNDDTQTSDLDSTNDSTVEFSTSTPANSFVKNVNSIPENRFYTTEHSLDKTFAFDSFKDDLSNDSAIGSRTSTSAESLVISVDYTVLGNRVNDIEQTESLSKIKREVNEDDVNEERSSIKDVLHPERSAYDDSILKDENSISKYGLDDVYPEIIQDHENPSRMVQLVRTKRFGDSFVYPEAPDSAYANELDNSRAMDEPYAEDNRIIDSMLSKVDYRSLDKQERPARRDDEMPFNEEGIDPDNRREEASVRGKRGTFPKRTRKKAISKSGHRRHRKKQKKHRKGHKKHHSKHSKTKRPLRDLSTNGFDTDNSLTYGKRDDFSSQFSDSEEDVISPHDGRRRRESENENFYSYPNEAPGRVRRDVQKFPETDLSRDSRANNAGKIKKEANSHEKKNGALQEHKNIKNKREVVQNRSNEIADRIGLKPEATVAIRDIKLLAAHILDKVDEIQSYIAEGNEDEEQRKNAQAFGTLPNTSNAEQSSLKVFQQNGNSRSADKDTPKEAKIITHPEGCWKHPTSWNLESQTAKNSRPARNPQSRGCGKKSLRRKRTSHRKWDRWTDWSSCSVTCGRGRQIRWRHCVRNCSTAETEMEEKACQLPACSPGKFLGIFG